MAMTDEQRQYFDAMDALFTSLGWKLLADDIKGFTEAISDQWASIKPEDLRFIQGRYDGLKQIAAYPEMIDKMKAACDAEVENETNLLEHYD